MSLTNLDLVGVARQGLRISVVSKIDMNKPSIATISWPRHGQGVPQTEKAQQVHFRIAFNDLHKALSEALSGGDFRTAFDDWKSRACLRYIDTQGYFDPSNEQSTRYKLFQQSIKRFWDESVLLRSRSTAVVIVHRFSKLCLLLDRLLKHAIPLVRFSVEGSILKSYSLPHVTLIPPINSF